MTIKKYIGILLWFFSFSSFAMTDDFETDVWAKFNYTHQLIGEANNKILMQSEEIAQLKSHIHLHQIGEEYHGGVIFWLDETRQHGLIASKIDVSKNGIQWRNGSSGTKVTNAKGDGIGAGETNTRLIIAGQTSDNQKGQFAALIASQFQIQEDGITPCKTPIARNTMCYGGWYLPSAYELQLMYTNLHERSLSYFAPVFYWSSTEENAANAWLINFSTGQSSIENKSNTIGQVRPISHF